MYSTDPLFQESHIFFGQRPKIRLDISSECVGVHLIRRFGIAEIFIWRRSSNQKTQVIVRKVRDAINIFLFLVRHICGDIANMVDCGIVKGQRIRAKDLVLRNTGRR